MLVLWRQLRGIGDIVDDFAGAEDMRRAAVVWEFKLLQLESRLMQLADVFDKAGIDMIPLKGAGLAYSAYDSFTDRPMNDLDLLIPEEQAMDAFRIAQEHGWVWDAAVWPLEKYDAHHHLPPLKDAEGSGVRAEIHVEMCLPGSPIEYPAEVVWKNARIVDVAGRHLTIPSTVDQMLYTCIHFAWMHALKDKAWISFLDIAAYVRSGDVDWPRFVELARQTKADTCAYWTLRLARSLSRIPVPDEVLAELKPPLSDYMLRWLERHYALNMFPTDSYCPSVWLEDKLFRVGVRRGPHVVEMHGFVKQDEEDAEPEQPPGFWSLILNHLKRWKFWIRYVRLAVMGRPG